MGALRTVTLPVNPGASWDDLAWAEKAPGDMLPYVLDCTAWLADAGLSIVGTLTLTASAGLTARVVSVTNGVVTLLIGGGVASTISVVALAIGLTGGDTLTVSIQLPIRAGAAGLSVPSAPLPYSPVSNIYTGAGAIAPADTYALINSASAVAVTLAAGTADGHAITIANFGAGTATLTIATLLGQANAIETMPQGAVLNLVWSTSLNTYLYAS